MKRLTVNNMEKSVTEKIKVEVGFEELYQQLNDEQKQAVDAIEGPVMVLAGPGTGKTQVLAMRIGNILRRTDLDPWNILCLTFTESAAVAMRQRLIQLIGEAAYYVRIYTFHSFGNDVVQEHPEHFALAKEWQALTDIERIELFRKLLDELSGMGVLKPLGSPYMWLKDIMSAVQSLKKEDVSPEEFKTLLIQVERMIKDLAEPLNEFFGLKPKARTNEVSEELMIELGKRAEVGKYGTAWVPYRKILADYAAEVKAAEGEREAGKLRTKLKNDLKRMYEKAMKQLPKQAALQKIYAVYQQELSSVGRYDYEDMIMQVVLKWREDDALLAEYQEQYQYVLVDEWQDTNGAQNEVVRLLGSFDEAPNVFVVGDDKQSVFRFQGASLENLMNFYERHKEQVKIVSLKSNYRSKQTVLDAAAGVISNNTESVTKYVKSITDDLVAVREGKEELLEQYVFDTVAEEDYFIVQKIKELLAAGVAAEEIVVLYRFNRDVESLLDLMLHQGVPVRLEAGENVLINRRVRQLLTLMQLVADEKHDYLLAEVVHYDWLRLEPLEVMKVLYKAGADNRKLVEVISDAGRLKEAGVKRVDEWLAMINRIATWRVTARNHTLQHLFDAVLQESGMLSVILDRPDELPVLNSITSLFNEVKRLNQVDPDLTVEKLLLRLKLLDENGLSLMAERWQTQTRAVRLMTAHRAKGLEFEQVFIARSNDKHWGNLRERRQMLIPAGLLAHDAIVGQQFNEDERRLFYVALTRAKDRIYLTHTRQGETGREQVPSVFLNEIPGALMKQVELIESEDQTVKRLRGVRQESKAVVTSEEVKVWLKGQLKNYVMSVTHLNNYLECPRLWYYRNLLRVPSAKTLPLIYGTVVHNALRDLFNKLNDGESVGGEYLAARFKAYLKRELLTAGEKKDMELMGVEALKKYFVNYSDTMTAKTLLEYNFKTHGVQVAGLPLTGKVDKVELPQNGREITVVDYKTGNPDSVGKKWRPDGSYYRQLVFYKLLGDESPRFDYRMAAGELDFVQESRRTGKFVKRRYEIKDREVMELKETIERVWGEIKSLKFLESESCGECEYCGLQS